MRILVLSEGLPSRIGGGRSRQFNLLKSLSSRHDYTVITYGGPNETQAAEDLRKICDEVILLDLPPLPPANRSRLYYRVTGWKHTLFESQPKRGRWLITRQARNIVSNTLQSRPFDLVQVHQGYMAPLLPTSRRYVSLLDMHDVLSDFEKLNLDLGSGFGAKLGTKAEWRKMVRFEQRTISSFDACTVVSDNDRCSVRELVPEADPIVVPNGVDADYFKPVDGQSSEPNVLFVGSMNYAPNETGVLHFCDSIWPDVKKSVPDAQLLIVGTSPSESALSRSGKEGVTVIGEVPDVRPYFERARVSICPIYTASGTRLKILDAWSMQKPVVSTELGALGLDARHGDNIFIADTDALFAHHVVELLLNHELGQRIGEAGRRTITEKYAWTQIAEQLQVAYHRAVEVANRRGSDNSLSAKRDSTRNLL